MLILCKTYPIPSAKYSELSCVAGIDSQGMMIRLFPVPFRLIDSDDVPAPIARGPELLLGLKDVRGQGVPVIDLRLKLGMSPTVHTQDTRIVVLDVDLGKRSLPLGLVADRVYEVTSFDLLTVEPPPEVGVTWPSDYIAGVILKDEQFVVIVDLSKMFGRDEVAEIAPTALAACGGPLSRPGMIRASTVRQTGHGRMATRPGIGHIGLDF